ncbi:glycosyltransferase family 2 protein [uncultured Polaribacter sp.]|uniref:glycosyltransferase family 2 protein n=1 Tax=uncultured Polaribacter sp. TaxID=174711 RepID=UPI0026188A39|nr:glycosyltransferase family 2 protein [uncultured Polaribacter sp.]
MNSKPLISIIIPVFNRASIISETLDSIINQTYENWECIIVDDGSVDNFKQIINKYKDLDARFIFVKRPANKLRGGNAARNYGLKLSKGAYVNWFDSDDIMLPNFLSDKIKVLLLNKDYDFCACLGASFLNSIDNIIEVYRPLVINSTNYIEDYLLNGLSFFTPSPLWKKDFLIKHNLLFNENLKRSQEKEFHLRVLGKSPNYFYLEKPLFLIRLSTNGGITTNFKSNHRLQMSDMIYFDIAYKTVKSSKIKNKVNIYKYLFYRQSVNFYNILIIKGLGFKKRYSFSVKEIKKLYSYFRSSQVSYKYFLKIIFGTFLVLFIKKGYKCFYYPEFNYRSYKD